LNEANASKRRKKHKVVKHRFEHRPLSNEILHEEEDVVLLGRVQKQSIQEEKQEEHEVLRAHACTLPRSEMSITIRTEGGRASAQARLPYQLFDQLLHLQIPFSHQVSNSCVNSR